MPPKFVLFNVRLSKDTPLRSEWLKLVPSKVASLKVAPLNDDALSWAPVRLALSKLTLDISLPAKVTLEIPALGLKVPFDGEIRLK